MKTKEMLAQLSKIFSEFKNHPAFIKELRDIIDNISNKKQFFNQLMTQLEHVKNMGCMAYMADHNEKIKGTDGRYISLHLKSSQYNIRFLVHITDSGYCYFLTAFYERSGKSRSDYSEYVSVLNKRLESLLGDDQNE